MAAPEVPIEVDPETGVWTTDGLPMIYLPRHFLVNNHGAVEAALGVEAYSKLLYDAGYDSARAWCEAVPLTVPVGWQSPPAQRGRRKYSFENSELWFYQGCAPSFGDHIGTIRTHFVP